MSVAVLQIKAVASSHVETLAIAPRLPRLKEMLYQCPFTEEEGEANNEGDVHTNLADNTHGAQEPEEMPQIRTSNNHSASREQENGARRLGEGDQAVENQNANSSHWPGKGYTWLEILDQVQASEEEILSGLKSLKAVKINGRWRVVSEELMGEVLHTLLLAATAKGWRVERLADSLAVRLGREKGFREEVVRHCLKVHSKAGMEEVRGEETDVVWVLDETAVCVHYAKKLLKSGRLE